MTNNKRPARIFGPARPATLSPLLLAVLLAGCDADEASVAAASASPTSPAAPIALSVTPSLGQTFAADVRVIAPGGGGLEVAELARGQTDSSGEADVEVPADEEGPYIIEVSGNETASYYDEGSDQDVALGADDQMRTVIAGPPAAGEHIAVTPLTEMACRYLEAAHGPLELLTREQLAELFASGQVADAFERVRQEMAPELGGAGINTVPKLVGSAADLAALGATDADLYALKLAALARVAHVNGSARPALAMMEKLATDFIDGSVNGMSGLLALGTDTYDVTRLAAQLDAAAQELGTSPDIQDALAIIDNYVSAFLVALGASTDPGDGGGDPLPTGPGDLLASWAGDYHGSWNVNQLEAKIYMGSWLGWQRDIVTETALKAAMEVMTFVGNGCHWTIGVQNVSLGTINIPFSEAYAVAAAGDARTYTLPTNLTVLDYGVTGTATLNTQNVLPTKLSFAYNYKTPLNDIKYSATCTFSYKL